MHSLGGGEGGEEGASVWCVTWQACTLLWNGHRYAASTNAALSAFSSVLVYLTFYPACSFGSQLVPESKAPNTVKSNLAEVFPTPPKGWHGGNSRMKLLFGLYNESWENVSFSRDVPFCDKKVWVQFVGRLWAHLKKGRMMPAAPEQSQLQLGETAKMAVKSLLWSSHHASCYFHIWGQTERILAAPLSAKAPRGQVQDSAMAEQRAALPIPLLSFPQSCAGLNSFTSSENVQKLKKGPDPLVFWLLYTGTGSYPFAEAYRRLCPTSPFPHLSVKCLNLFSLLCGP